MRVRFSTRRANSATRTIIRKRSGTTPSSQPYRSRQLGRSGGSESESDQKLPLMMPQELKEMSQREQIINLENTKAIKCTKIRYYENYVFLDRLAEVDPSLLTRNFLGMRRKPTQRELERSWGSWKLAAPVPTIDFDLHDAIVQSRMREVTPDDIAGGIDLRKLAMDTSKIRDLAAGQELPPEQVQGIVADFFDALDAASQPSAEGIGDEDAVSDEELARLDAEAAAETDNDDGDGDGDADGDRAAHAAEPPAAVAAAPAAAIAPIVVKPVAQPEPPAEPAPADAVDDLADEGDHSEAVAEDDVDADAEGNDVPELDEDDEARLYDELPDLSDFDGDTEVVHPDDEVLEDDDAAPMPAAAPTKPILDLSILDSPIERK
ncbi:type IV secretory system conjugative DNA transfer family protein [Xanthomonas citri]|uniref:type IV secretory system conjugative DNA transfer family protein n=1 Tax=Xanthomonas citri TaxID=346 RepID=UPI0022AEBA66|nr:type IV secretory system conjugative DNA transfer family protein [Xanthomonas citri]